MPFHVRRLIDRLRHGMRTCPGGGRHHCRLSPHRPPNITGEMEEEERRWDKTADDLANDQGLHEIDTDGQSSDDVELPMAMAASTATLVPLPDYELSDLPLKTSPMLPSVSPGFTSARSSAAQSKADFDLTDIDLDQVERSATYSSLPPSPRGEYRGDFSSQRTLDLESANHRLDPSSSPRKRRLSLESAPESELDDVEQFWPARSRRQTLDGGEPPRFLAPDPHSPILEGEELDGDGSESVEISLQTGAPDVEPLNVPQAKRDGLSLWDLLKEEDAAEQWEGWIADGKWERITNFLAVPLAVEKVTLFGALLCLDGFLYNFTILPIRATFAISRLASRIARRQSLTPIPPAHIQSILRLLLLILPAVVLLVGTDASKMYHSVRGQDTIKLYVIFNALEIGDRLCCAFGQDVLDTLFARDTLDTLTYNTTHKRRKREHVRPVFFFTLSLAYVLVHAVVFFYMLIALNVAINSYDYTLISLLISNQFVEIKGSVFKKFEKENLFQIMCADIVERFQLGLMLVIIAVRNMIEMAGSDIAFLPKSFTRGKSLVERTLSPVLFVLASEMVVDWLKHAFITKFNHVRATVYGRFTDILAKDVLVAGTLSSGRERHKKRKHPILLDQSPLVARRLGIASVPLAVLVIRIGAQVVGMLTTTTAVDSEIPTDWWWTALKWAAGILVGMSAWGCLVVVKILLGLGLLSYSALRQSGMAEREAEDAVNDFGRQPPGISKEEIEYNKQTTRYLSHPDDDLPNQPSASAHATPRANGVQLDLKDKGKKKSWKLEEVERWTMVKRIW